MLEKETEQKVEASEKTTQSQVNDFSVESDVSQNVQTDIIQQVAEVQQEELKQEEVLYNDAYVSTFENLTISDIKKEQERKELEQFKLEKEELLKNQTKSEATKQNDVKEEASNIEDKTVKKLVIEKPNYDLIENAKLKPKKSRKSLKKIIFCCALAMASIGCVTNCVIIDNLSSQYIAVEDSYNLNLFKYLKNINNLNASNKSLELFETYPEELQNPSSLGKSSNWFDKITNFIAGLFGG